MEHLEGAKATAQKVMELISEYPIILKGSKKTQATQLSQILQYSKALDLQGREARLASQKVQKLIWENKLIDNLDQGQLINLIDCFGFKKNSSDQSLPHTSSDAHTETEEENYEEFTGILSAPF